MSTQISFRGNREQPTIRRPRRQCSAPRNADIIRRKQLYLYLLDASYGRFWSGGDTPPTGFKYPALKVSCTSEALTGGALPRPTCPKSGCPPCVRWTPTQCCLSDSVRLSGPAPTTGGEARPTGHQVASQEPHSSSPKNPDAIFAAHILCPGPVTISRPANRHANWSRTTRRCYQIRSFLLLLRLLGLRS